VTPFRRGAIFRLPSRQRCGYENEGAGPLDGADVQIPGMDVAKVRSVNDAKFVAREMLTPFAVPRTSSAGKF